MARGRAGGERRAFRRSFNRWYLVACCGGFGLVGVSQIPSSAHEGGYYGPDSGFVLGSRVASACLAIVCLFLMVKIARMGVFTDEDGLTVRGLWRTHRVGWGSIAAFERPACYGALRNTGLKIVRTDGSIFHAGLYSAGPLNRPEFADESVAELELLRARYTEG